MFTWLLLFASRLLLCLFMVGPGESDMTCIEFFGNRFRRTPEDALWRITVADWEPVLPWIWLMKLTLPFIPASWVWGRYLFMATFGVYYMTL